MDTASAATASTRVNVKPQCTPLVNATAPPSVLAAWPMPNRLVATAVATAPTLQEVRAAGVLILAGGIGNLIDRIFRGFVVDFLYFSLIDFPVFNIADCCVCIGAALLIVYTLFFYRETPESKKEETIGDDHSDRPAAGGGDAAG